MADEKEKKVKRPRKLIKSIENGLLTIQVVGVDPPFKFNPKDYPKEVQEQLPVIAISHILGDSAAGETGQGAFDSIKNKHEAMMAGKMTTRKAAAPSVKQSDLLANYLKLSDKEKRAAAPFLKSLGVEVPA